MYEKQHTLQNEVTLHGVGLHSGQAASVTFRPAPDDHGLVFRRIDLPGQPTIPALVDHVVDLQRSTTIGLGGATAQTIEHSLAALAGLQIDNCLIDIDGPELPILDGSAAPFVAALRQAGLQEQRQPRNFFVVDEPVRYRDPQRHIDIAALPLDDDFRVTVMIDYNSQVLGIQHATLVQMDDFADQFAPARTFVFLHELELLHKAGLIRGGSLDNAIVIVDRQVSPDELRNLGHLFGKPDIQVAQEGVLNNLELHYPDEPARHKLLDVVGDLTLLGHPLKAQVIAARPGHAANVQFTRLLREKALNKARIRKYQSNPEAKNGIVFDVNDIARILPHRYPFLLLDRITHFTQKSIEGVKNVTVNEPFFNGHFPGNPVMPGVLQIEAMAQAGGILLLNIVENPADNWVYLLAIENARFRKPVVPGDQLVLRIELENIKRNICKMSGKAYVDGQVVSEALLTASLVKKN